MSLKHGGGDVPKFVVMCKGGLYMPAVVSSMPAYLGFVSFMLGAERWLFYVFIIIAALGMIYNRPKRDDIIDYIITDQKALEEIE